MAQNSKTLILTPFCSDQGLEHKYSSPYTPQQNGVVERKNRTLVEMARTMLDEHRTPRKYWAEAVNTAYYVSNRIFLRAFMHKTCYELRFGRQLLMLLSAPNLYTASARFHVAFPSEYSPKVYQSTEPKRQETI